MRRWPGWLLLLGAVLVAACSGGGDPSSTDPPSSGPVAAESIASADDTQATSDAPDADATNPACPPLRDDPNAPDADWIHFVHVDGISYDAKRGGPELDEGDLGAEFAMVLCQRSTSSANIYQPVRDGDAGFLPAGTTLYEVRGYAPSFRLAARFEGRIELFEVDSNASGQVGEDLLDLAGKVVSIGINSATDGRTELAAITEPSEVAALVDLVLAAAIDHEIRSEGRRYFIEFRLQDGSEVRRSYWVESGELSRGILLPETFRAAVEDALAPDSSSDSETEAAATGEVVELSGARVARLRVPASYDASRPMPLVMLLHGYTSTSRAQDAYFGLSQRAEIDGFLLLLPEGRRDQRGQQFWNGTDACCDLFGVGGDDVSYLVGLILEAGQRYAVDSERVWVVGHSNGGFMAYRLACDGAPISAIVSLAGSEYADESICDGAPPLHVLQIHGDQDAVISYAGVASLGPGAGGIPRRGGGRGALGAPRRL